MLKPFYQGKLDTFCAIYAVLNALRLTHGLRVLKARDILNETLMGLAATPQAFRAVLEQETDYCALVDGMLRVQRRSFPLEIRQPFAVTAQPRRPPGSHLPLYAPPHGRRPGGQPPLDHGRQPGRRHPAPL